MEERRGNGYGLFDDFAVSKVGVDGDPWGVSVSVRRGDGRAYTSMGIGEVSSRRIGLDTPPRGQKSPDISALLVTGPSNE